MKHLQALPVLALSITSFLYMAEAAAQGEVIGTIQDPPPAEELFNVVEQMPQYPGGEAEMFKYLARTVRYPEEAQKAGIQGAVYVTFIVEKDGAIQDVSVLRGIGGGCDEEAVRAVTAMPNWEPGMQRGKPVRVLYNLPVRYALSAPAKKKKR